MINTSFHLAVYTFLFFLIGMYNPKWALFFLKKPDRFTVSIVTTIFIMATMTLYGEGLRQKKQEEQATERVIKNSVTPTAPVPVPNPAPAPVANPK